MRFVFFSMAVLAAVLAFALVGASFAQVVPVDLSKAHGYQVGPGDEITVKVVGEPDFDFAARVNEDGKIDLPFDEAPMEVRCKTERELKGQMREILARYLRKPQFN